VEVLEHGFERTTLAAVIERHHGAPPRVERRGLFPLCRGEQLSFRNEQERGVGIHEPRDQPRARDPIDFDVLARDPSHAHASFRHSSLPGCG
jgi:hypothetical protein